LQEYNKDKYVEILTDQIRCRKARSLVGEEILQHIEDQTLCYMEAGMEKAEAEKEAVRQMGDPVTVGNDLDRIHRPRLDIKLFLMMSALILAGVAVQYILFGGTSEIFLRQLVITVMSLAVMFIVYRMDYTFLAANAFGLWVGWGIILASGICLGLFPRINGQFRIYHYLMASVPVYSGLLYRFRNSGYKGLFCCGGIAALNLFLCLTAPSYLTALELLIIYTAMLTCAVYRGWFSVGRMKGILTIYIPIGIITALMTWRPEIYNTYLFRRLDAALHPEKYPNSYGYVACTIRDRLEGLQLFGNDPGVKSMEAIFSTEMVSSDMILTHILECYGVLAGAVLLAALAALIFRIFVNAHRQKNQLGSMVGFGCACILLTQTISYVTYNLGFTIWGARYLPFLSRSGTGILFTCLLMGLILSVYRNTNIMKERTFGDLPKYRIRIEKIIE